VGPVTCIKTSDLWRIKIRENIYSSILLLVFFNSAAAWLEGRGGRLKTSCAGGEPYLAYFNNMNTAFYISGLEESLNNSYQ
jgi:hypothetical protein